MTGFGRAAATISNRQVSAEIKSLNGKQFEIISKFPQQLRAYEMDIRSALSALLLRGTTDVTISIKQDGMSRPVSVNVELAITYYRGMQEIARRLEVPEQDMLPTIMRMPEIVSSEQDVISEQDWVQIRALVMEAAGQLMEHRRQEGFSLEKDLITRIGNIEEHLQKILTLEPQRMEKVRLRLRNSLKELAGGELADENRFEQELIYYLEKMDFSEEKNRLTQHCNYFLETLAKEEKSKGKVLGFILQEIGREINTMGAKANDAAIQQIVVLMKDELEKAKEQVLNAL
jgi:uncharacterized protein (TIGR00255 family)